VADLLHIFDSSSICAPAILLPHHIRTLDLFCVSSSPGTFQRPRVHSVPGWARNRGLRRTLASQWAFLSKLRVRYICSLVSSGTEPFFPVQSNGASSVGLISFRIVGPNNVVPSFSHTSELLRRGSISKVPSCRSQSRVYMTLFCIIFHSTVA